MDRGRPDGRRGGGARGRPVPRREGDAGQRARAQARLAELLAMGLPEQTARAVVAGQRDLNDVLQALAREHRAVVLSERHRIDRSLALQVVDGHADLEQLLSKRRRKAYMAASGQRSIFTDRLASDRPLVLGLLGHAVREGRVLEVAPYEIRFAPADAGPEETLHKLQVKYAHDPADARGVRKALGRDAALAAVEARPLVRMQDRVPLPDRLLFPWFEKQTRLVVTLVEGEQWTGTIAWMSRYEFGFSLKTGIEVDILRHAVARVELT